MTPHEPYKPATFTDPDSGPHGRRARFAMSLGLRIVVFVAGALALGFATTWAFLAYLNPEMVFDFAALLQSCGIPLPR